jgi:hypothetical protein
MKKKFNAYARNDHWVTLAMAISSIVEASMRGKHKVIVSTHNS